MSVFEIMRSIPYQFQLGDPTFLGWLTAGMYVLTAVPCLYCAKNAKKIFNAENIMIHRVIWLGLAGGLFFLGINKQLDLQSWFTAVAKTIAWEQGWYEKGQQAQIYFLAGIGLSGLIALLTVSWLIRKQWRRYSLLLLGFIFILRFVLVRIGTFYGIPLPELSTFTGGIRLNWLLELVGVAIIGVCALQNLRQRQSLPIQQLKRS